MAPHTEHIVGYLIERLGESSTVRGAIQVVCVIAGVTLDPARTEAYLAAAVGIGALLKVILPDRFFDYRRVSAEPSR